MVVSASLYLNHLWLLMMFAMKNVRPLSWSRRFRRDGFTVIQLLLVIALLGILSAILFPVLSRARANADRQNCDVKLKSIVLALDAFKQERGQYPKSLDELRTGGFLTDPDALRCSRDPRPNGSYNDYYAVRAPGDAGELPVVMCPFHEALGNAGNQGRLGRFTTEFATRPATLTSGNAVQIERPGEEEPLVGYAGMELRGGDKIITNASGTALVTFADTSSARLEGGTQMTVLQSFIDGHSGARLYTLVRQFNGGATYTINHGSRFDVSTPATTAGARGTKFHIKVSGNTIADTELVVYEGKVVFTTPQKSGLVLAPPAGQPAVPVNGSGVGGLLRWLLG